MMNTPQDAPECPICGGSINGEVCVDCGRGRGARTNRGAWGERFEYEGDKYDPCIEGEEDWT